MILSASFFAFGSAMAEETKAPGPGGEKAAAAVSQPRLVDKDYAIQAGDVLEISVWREKDLEKIVLVRPDGGINFPLVGDIMAAGKTIDQIQSELAAKLAKFVPDPVVSVSVKQALGNKIYVIGKVNHPGEVVANRDMDVMQALSVAGGLTPFASANKIKILRRDEKGEIKSIPFKYSNVEKGKDLEQNIILRGGDVVVVP